jgi:acetoin utilization protein AcuB
MFYKNVKIGQIMTAEVQTVTPKDTMDKAAEIFKSNNFHHLPVLNNGKVVGMVSSTDYHMLEDHFTLFNNKNSVAVNEAIMRSLLVEDVMTEKLVMVSPEDEISIAADIFRENLFHALPVVDADKNFVGIITPYDLLNFAYAGMPALEEVAE